MPSAIAKKTTKSTSASSSRIKKAEEIVTLRPCKGTLSATRFDAIVKKQGGRALTAAERREFRRFAKDPHP